MTQPRDRSPIPPGITVSGQDRPELSPVDERAPAARQRAARPGAPADEPRPARAARRSSRRSLLQSLRSPQTLRRAILLSEILSTPRALRADQER